MTYVNNMVIERAHEVNRQGMMKFCKVMLRCLICSSVCTFALIGVILLILTILIAKVGSVFPICYGILFGTDSPALLDLPTAVCNDVNVDLPGSLTLTCQDLTYSRLYRVCVDKKYSAESPHCLTLDYNKIICRPQDHESCLPASYTYKSGQSLMFGLSIFNSTSNKSFYFFMDTESGEYYVRFLTESSTLSSVWYSVLGCQYAVNILLAWFSLLAIFFFLVICSCCMCCCHCYCCKLEKRFPIEDDETGILLGQRRRMQRDPSVEDFQDSQEEEEEGFQSEDNSKGATTEAVETSMLLTQQRRLQEEQNEMGYRDFEGDMSEDDPEGYVTAEDQWEETNTRGPSRPIFPTSGCFVSTYPSLNSVNSNGARSDVTFGGERSLHSGMSGSTRSFLAIEDTNEKVEPPPFARLRLTVFEVVTHEERGNPDGGNVS